ncbi:MAG: vWA domain-containing protein [Myxococcota bacterium]
MRILRKGRRGSYATLYAVSAVALVAFGAIAVDLSMLRLADAEIQAVADAAAQAAILELRASNDRTVATTIANNVVSRNRVAGTTPASEVVEFGVFESGVFTVNNVTGNAVRATVGVNLDLPFSSFWGANLYTLRSVATAAVRPIHTLIVMDITNSWNATEFAGARAGALAVFDHMAAASGQADRIGLVTFHGKHGTEYTPLTFVDQAVLSGVRADWQILDRAAKVGAVVPDPRPAMPLEFDDEGGTDHAIGIQMATKMFSELPDPTVYRAMIVITDGSPADVKAHLTRGKIGYAEERWRSEFTGATARTKAEIQSDSQSFAKTAWDNAEVHTWMVSFKQDGEWMKQVPHGDGYYIRANSTAELVAIFEDIAESLPITLVE